MVRCLRYTPDMKSDWDKFVQSSRTPLFMFERNFIEYHSDRFEDSSLVLLDDTGIIALLPANKVDNKIMSHGGLTYGGLIFAKKFSAEKIVDAAGAMIKTLQGWGIEALQYKSVPHIFHDQPCEEAIYALTRHGALISRRDLSSVVKLSDRPKFSTLRKRKIKTALSSGIEIISDTNFAEFHRILSVSLSKHGVLPVHSIEELTYLKSKFPNNIELLLARKGEKIVAGILLFIFRSVVHTQYISVSDDGANIGALDLLISEAIDSFEEKNFQYFSFGISTEDNGEFLNAGLIRQKEGFGGRGIVIDTYEVPLGG